MSELQAGQRARKTGGSYEADGTIVSAFKTLGGADRYVFEFDSPAGMLHIFGPSNLVPLPNADTDDGSVYASLASVSLASRILRSTSESHK